MDIQFIQDKIKRREYEISLHAEKERYAENITLKDIEEAVDSGEILEDYPEDPRGPSCLIVGYSSAGPIHMVCGYASPHWVRIITVYLPKPPMWKDERTRNRKG